MHTPDTVPPRRGDSATRLVSAVAALMVGAAVGAGTTAGAALLLYTGRGFLATAGFLIAVSIAAVAAGLWVGAPEENVRAAASRRRWIWTVLAFLAAAVFTTLWSERASVRTLALGGALAVLLILAEPAYASGTLLATLDTRGRAARWGATTAVAALLGGAVGVLAAATLLIPNFDAPGIYYAAAGLLAITGMIESARAFSDPTAGRRTMKERVAIVTGAGDRGQVGFAIAQRFLEAGARLVITGHSARVHDLVGELAERGQVVAVQADLTIAEDAARVVELAKDRYGRLDALINVAGGLTVIRPLADTQPEEWRREVERNADTAFLLSRAALPLLRESRGAIVNFAAPAGERAVRNLGAYSAAKAAVVALTRALALEERVHGVRVNAIAPGLIDTEQNRRSVENPDQTKWVTREEIAEAALFLVGPGASGISGETVHVMGENL
jgi:NAD(P)-dependent dehydrogenase (short-subunit alcohol dehydrogenase family)